MPILEATSHQELTGLQLHVWPADSTQEQSINFRNQIISKSREPHIEFWEPQDAIERFSDTTNYEKWASQGRIIIGLAQGAELGGICYFGKKAMPVGFDQSPSVTVGIRMYESMQGKGLAFPFFKQAHEVLRRYMSADRFWLSARVDNERAKHLYEKYGYVERGTVAGLSIMTYDREDR